jgi:hypothetical protein
MDDHSQMKSEQRCCDVRSISEIVTLWGLLLDEIEHGLIVDESDVLVLDLLVLCPARPPTVSV